MAHEFQSYRIDLKMQKKYLKLSQEYIDLYNFAPVGYFTLDKEGIILEVNKKGESLLDTERPGLINNLFIFFIKPKFRNLFYNTLKKTSVTFIKHECTLELIKKDKTTFWAEISINFSQVQNKYIISVSDIDKQKTVERALLENERKFRISLETLLDAFAIFSSVRDINNNIIDFKFEYINEFGCKLNKRTYGEQVGYNLSEIFPELKSELFNDYINVVETGNSLVKEVINYENILGKKKLSSSYDIQAVKLGDGFAITWRDVTERKKAEKMLKQSLKEKEILLREIHHRIKNNMQVISSILGLQSMYIKDKNVADILDKSKERVKSISLVHEKLYGSKDVTKINFKEYIQDLSIHLLNTFNANHINLKIECENLFLDLDTAISCGLIINELITNSIKYAFPSNYYYDEMNKNSANQMSKNDSLIKPENNKNEIFVNLVSDENEFMLTIGDNGIGMHDKNIENSDTLGFSIVTALVNQIYGKIKIFNKKGTNFEIRFPCKL